MLTIASQNNDALKVFEKQNSTTNKIIRVGADEVKAKITFSDGTSRLQEFYWGNTFQSQSSRVIVFPKNAKTLTFYDAEGQEVRTID